MFEIKVDCSASSALNVELQLIRNLPKHISIGIDRTVATWSATWSPKESFSTELLHCLSSEISKKKQQKHTKTLYVWYKDNRRKIPDQIFAKQYSVHFSTLIVRSGVGCGFLVPASEQCVRVTRTTGKASFRCRGRSSTTRALDKRCVVS